MTTNTSHTVKTSSGVRVNADTAAYMAKLAAARAPKAFCTEHPAFHADNCPSCGTARMSR